MLWRLRARAAAFVDIGLSLTGACIFMLRIYSFTTANGRSLLFTPWELCPDDIKGIIFTSLFLLPIIIQLLAAINLLLATKCSVEASRTLDLSKFWRNSTILTIIIQSLVTIPAEIAWPFYLLVLRIACFFTVLMFRDEAEKLIKNQSELSQPGNAGVKRSWRVRAVIAAIVDMALTATSIVLLSFFLFFLAFHNTAVIPFIPDDCDVNPVINLILVGLLYIPFFVELWAAGKIVYTGCKSMEGEKALKMSKLWKNLTILVLITQLFLTLLVKSAIPVVFFTLRLVCFFTVIMHRDELGLEARSSDLLAYESTDSIQFNL